MVINYAPRFVNYALRVVSYAPRELYSMGHWLCKPNNLSVGSFIAVGCFVQ